MKLFFISTMAILLLIIQNLPEGSSVGLNEPKTPYIHAECQVNPDGHGICIDRCKQMGPGLTGCCYPEDATAGSDQTNAPGKCVCCEVTDVCFPRDGNYRGRACPNKACFFEATGVRCPA